MKALTICQPFADLILNGVKRTENRTWKTSYRGTLYIHAGKSKKWMALGNAGTTIGPERFGAVVGVATLIYCAHINDIRGGKMDRSNPWLRDHEHATGPWCWMLEDVRRIQPIPWKGVQGLFNIEPADLDAAAYKLYGTSPLAG